MPGSSAACGRALQKTSIVLQVLSGDDVSQFTMPSDFEVILAALAKGDVRFVVVGGVAVVLQGSPRFTADLDLVVARTSLP